MRSQIAAIEQEIQNLDARDNKLTTADGSLNTMQSNLVEMRNVALAAANEGGNSEDSQKAYQTNMDNYVNAYNQTQENAAYGSQKLFDGSSGSVANPEKLENLDVSTPEKAQEAVAAIDQRMKEISDMRGQIGAEQKNEINSSRNNLQTELVNLTASESTVRDTDMAKEYADFVKSEIQVKAGMAMMAHQKQVPALVLGILQQ